MTAYKIASVAVCYNFIRRDRSWNNDSIILFQPFL